MKSSQAYQMYALMLTMLFTSFLAYRFAPSLQMQAGQTQQFNQLIPTQFGGWTRIESNQLQVDLTPKNEEGKSIDNPYDDVLMTSYQNNQGDIVSLALAYGASQRQEVKIHRPELCYYAQGFTVNLLTDTSFDIASLHNRVIVGKNMLVENNHYLEAVSYWIRIGDFYSQSPWQTRLHIIQKGLSGEVVDGVLVRASVVIKNKSDAQHAFETNKLFLQALMQSIPKQGQALLIQ